jgi:hypothetical protein
MKMAVLFVEDERELESALEALKQKRCPYCKRIGTFNRHDRLLGNRPDHASERRERGHRAWCSNRGSRGGCGRTVKILLAETLPRHTLTASAAWAILQGMLNGLSAKAASEKLRMLLSTDSVHRFLRRLRDRLGSVRAALLNLCRPPPSAAADPLFQTVQHLRCAFPLANNPIEAFQAVFQRPLMG